MPERLDTVHAFLAAAASKDGGAALAACLHPEMPWFANGRVQPVAAIAPADFAAAHARAANFGFVAGDVLVDQEDTLWLADATPERPPAVLGFGFHGDGRLTWLAVASRAPMGPDPLGAARMVADFPYLAGLPFPPRTWLDLSWHRQFGLPTPALDVLPNARFSCHGSTACCTVDYRISLDANAQAFIDAVPWADVHAPLAGTQLPTLPDGRLLLKGMGERCRFLDDGGQCRIHRAIGRSVFGPCTTHPYHFAETPDGIAVGTSALCPSARNDRGLPLPANTADIHARLGMAPVRRTARYGFDHDDDAGWPAFHAAEEALHQLLSLEGLALGHRLWLGTSMLPAFAAGEPVDLETWASEPIVGHDDEAWASAASLLALFPAWVRGGDGDIPRVAHADLRDPHVVVHGLRNALHSKRFSYKHGLVKAHNVMILAYLLTLLQQAPYKGRELPEASWQAFGLLLDHGSALDVLASGDIDEIAPIAMRLRDPAFGRWLLGFPGAHDPHQAF